MKRFYPVALALGLMTSLPASLSAQTPSTGNDTPAPAASPAPAPAATPAPAPAASPGSSATPADGSQKKTVSRKKSSGRKMTRKQEIDHSIQSGTVPSRYRSQIPKEYQQYIPFDKR